LRFHYRYKEKIKEYPNVHFKRVM